MTTAEAPSDAPRRDPTSRPSAAERSRSCCRRSASSSAPTPIVRAPARRPDGRHRRLLPAALRRGRGARRRPRAHRRLRRAARDARVVRRSCSPTPRPHADPVVTATPAPAAGDRPAPRSQDDPNPGRFDGPTPATAHPRSRIPPRGHRTTSIQDASRRSPPHTWPRSPRPPPSMPDAGGAARRRPRRRAPSAPARAPPSPCV